MVFGKARTPMDADGHFGGCPPQSCMEPELTVGGKVILVGSPVIRIRKALSDKTSKCDEDCANEITNEIEISSTNEDTCLWWPPWYDPSGPLRTLDQQAHSTSDEALHQQPSNSPSIWKWIRGYSGTLESTSGKPDDAIGRQRTNEPAGLFSWSGKAQNVADEADDDSTGDGSTSKLFGDLRSLPSINGDVTIGGESLTSTDFEVRDEHSIGRDSVVEKKLKEIIIQKEQHMPGTLNLTSNDDRPDSKSILHRRQFLVKELRAAIATYGRYHERCAGVSTDLGNLLNEAGEFDQAIKLHRDSVTIYSVKLGDHDPRTCNAKIHLASVLTNAGLYDEAVSICHSVMGMKKALKGEKDPSIADCLALIANTLRRNGDFHQAVKELKRALKIYRESLGDSHEKVANTVDAIASLYVTVGDFEKSSAILEEVVKLKAATVGMKSPAVAETLSCLAMTYECSGQLGLSMKALKKAYKIYTDIGGFASDESTATLSKIALLYEASGDYNRASIAFLGVLRGRKIHYGEDHLLVGETYCRLGHALRETGQLDKALKCMKEALPIYVGKGVEMNDIAKIADIMNEMALIYRAKQHFSEASRIFKQELSVRRKIGQPEFPRIAQILNLLGMTEYEMKNNSRALKYLVEALTIYQEQNDHGFECAEVLYNTGLVFSAAKNKDRAFEAFTEAERLFRECKSQDSQCRLLPSVQQEIRKLQHHAS